MVNFREEKTPATHLEMVPSTLVLAEEMAKVHVAETEEPSYHEQLTGLNDKPAPAEATMSTDGGVGLPIESRSDFDGHLINKAAVTDISTAFEFGKSHFALLLMDNLKKFTTKTTLQKRQQITSLRTAPRNSQRKPRSS